MYESWLQKLETAEKTSIIQGNVRKVHYKFSDGKEMAEEYSMETGVVLRRAWKSNKELMGDGTWTIELGDVPRILNDPNFTVKESCTAPVLSKRITRHSIEWRIRNLPYSIDTYLVAARSDPPAIIVRTTNKKYYKEITVPELERCETIPEQNAISIQHQYNTLIITYKKPQALLELEKAILLMLKNVETEMDDDNDTFLKELLK